MEEVTRPNQLLQTVSQASASFQCRDEVTDPHRSGVVRSSLLPHSNHTCSIVFRGEQRDLVMLRINTLHLSGANCSSSLRLSTQDQTQARGVTTVRQLCSPVSLRDHQESRTFPIIINSSLVFLDFQTVNQSQDVFTGAFSFHDGELGLHSHSNDFLSFQH